MCLSCWEKEGRPWEATDTARLWSEAFAEADPFGPLHVVVDDWNLDDENIQSCLDQTDPEPSEIERDLCLKLLEMTEGERWACAILADFPNFDPAKEGRP
jgi:hypothetical protein